MGAGQWIAQRTLYYYTKEECQFQTQTQPVGLPVSHTYDVERINFIVGNALLDGRYPFFLFLAA